MIRERLAEILEIDEDRITLDSNFADDLDADSLALIELVEALEEELGERTVGFTIDDEDLGDLHTVRDAVDYVVARLGSGSGARPEAPIGRGARAADPDSTRGCSSRSGWTFRDPALLDRALTHRSYCAEHGVEASNERLEFLGDAVLGLRRHRLRVRGVPAAARRASWPSCAPRW